MGQPYQVILDNSQLNRLREQTSGSKTFQYREEKRPTGIPLVAASETGKAQTQPQCLVGSKATPWDSLRRRLEAKHWVWGL